MNEFSRGADPPLFTSSPPFRLMLCKRVENEEWGTVDYINDKLPEENLNRIVFRTRKEVRRRPPTPFECFTKATRPCADPLTSMNRRRKNVWSCNSALAKLVER